MKKSIVLATAVATALTSGVAFAELTANAAFTSNYIWRGVTQTSDQAAAQGGIDWGHDSGLYVGTWASNIDFSGTGDGYEMDLYAGFAGEAGSLAYDLGVATFMYPVSPEFNFTEAYISGTMSVVTIGVAYTVDAASGNKDGVFDQGDVYVSGSIDFAAGNSDVSLYAGSYMFTNDGDTAGEVNYSNVGASISKDGFTFALDKNDIDDANPVFGTGTGSADNFRASVSYAIDFEL